MYYLTFFAPVDHVEKIKKALFEVGAGRFKNYDCCSFEVKGIGQFRPLEGSNPFIGKLNEIEYVEECRVEMMCEDKVIKDVINRLLEVHPYEEPAYFAIKILTKDDFY